MDISVWWDACFFWLHARKTLVTAIGVASLLMFFGTLAAVPVIIIALPYDVFTRRRDAAGRRRLTPGYVVYVIIKNAVGCVLLAAGIIMLVLPGQGLLTILLGLILVNFPGKREIVHRIVKNRRIAAAIASMRARCNRPPLELPD